MTNFHFLLIFLLPQSMADSPPVVPLTSKSHIRLFPPHFPLLIDALTTIYCHNDNEAGMMTIRCGPNEKIRMLDAYDVVVRNKSHLPLQCVEPKHFSLIHGDHPAPADCQMPTSFASACSGRENCTVHMQRKRLISAIESCHDELVDYTLVFFECISGT